MNIHFKLHHFFCIMSPAGWEHTDVSHLFIKFYWDYKNVSLEFYEENNGGGGQPFGGWFRLGKNGVCLGWTLSSNACLSGERDTMSLKQCIQETLEDANTNLCYYYIPGSTCSKPVIYLLFPKVPNTLAPTWKYSQWLGYLGQQVHYVTALGGTCLNQPQRRIPWREGETLVRIEATFPYDQSFTNIEKGCGYWSMSPCPTSTRSLWIKSSTW